MRDGGAHRAWKGALGTVAAALLGGAALTVAVAWGIAAAGIPTMREVLANPVLMVDHTGSVPLDGNGRTGWIAPGRTVAHPDVFWSVPDQRVESLPNWARGQARGETRIASGWPWRTMFTSRIRVPGLRPRREVVPNGIPTRSFDGRLAILPERIVAPAFVASTLLGAGLLMLATSAARLPRVLHRRRRWRRGRCIMCGHDLRGIESDRCPECGSARAHCVPRFRLPGPTALGALAAVLALAAGGLAVVQHARLDDPPPLHRAALRGDVVAIDALLAAGADVEAPGPALPDYGAIGGETPLMWACAGGHLDAVDRLIAAGADVTYEVSANYTTLDVAVWGDHLSIARRLLDAGAMPRTDGYATITYAATDGSIDMVRLLLPDSLDAVQATNAMYMAPIVGAAMSGRADVVRILVEAGAPLGSDIESAPLAAAIGAGSLETVEVLLDAGTRVTWSEYDQAIEKGDRRIIERLEAAFRPSLGDE